MPDQLCSMKIVTSSGEVCEFSEEISKSEFSAAKLSLGLLDDPNSLDPNRDQICIKNWVRTDEPVSFTQLQLEQSRKSQRQGAIQQYEFRHGLIQNP
ncbi:hypothetical protein F8M41_005507 [Gigaspora margarita]|uniref:Uncharacterized protein n=1 Tax=Gigaspora margarita TaxID=4874 RepID=A0A8H4ERU2_GIGMA|nr:hypothetical protein F8M41_005507 [Gigaspora margarita]